METTDVPVMRAALLDGERNRAHDDAFDLHGELAVLLGALGLTPADSGGEVRFDRRDPLIGSTVRLGATAALPLAMQSVAAASIWRLRTGLGQDIRIDLGQAMHRMAPLMSGWERINGVPADLADPSTIALFRFYETSDGRHTLPLNIYPRIKSAMLQALDCADNAESLARAIRRHTADELEKLGEEKGIVFVTARSAEEFIRTDVFEYLAARPVVEIEKIAGSAPESFQPGPVAPLSGVRALGMAHVIAGAGIGRSLGALGADCLNVWRTGDWEQDMLYATANVGTRSTRLDTGSPGGLAALHGLLRDADVFYANRRPGLLEKLGLGAADAAAIRPGLVHVTVSAYGSGGPWQRRVGFDQVAGAVTGMCVAEGTLAAPALPPTIVVNDFVASWLAAAGTMAALARRAAEGGSYRVHVSLTRAAMWSMSMGLFDPGYAASVAGSGDQHRLIDPQRFAAVTGSGFYQGLTENVTMSATPYQYLTVLPPRGSGQPCWLPRYPSVASSFRRRG